MKIGNRIHIEVPVAEIEVGDYVFVLEGACRGRRLRRVSAVVHGRKVTTLSLEEVKVGRCVLARARRVTVDQVLGAWRRRGAERAIEGADADDASEVGGQGENEPKEAAHG